MILSIVAFIVMLGLVVIIHECGHFFMAKLFGVGVDEFGLGFPPRLFGKTMGKTLYSINLIPIGGFVKIKGVVGGDQFNTPTSNDFISQAWWKRFSILFAGIMMNLVLAGGLLAFGYSVIGLPANLDHVPTDATVTNAHLVVLQLSPEAPANQQGLLAGDIIQQVNGQPVVSVQELQNALTALPTNADLPLLVEHSTGDTAAITITPMILPQSGQRGIGAYFGSNGTIHLPPLSAIGFSAEQVTWSVQEIILGLGHLIAGLFQGQAVGDSVAGPVGIAKLSGEVTQLGFPYMLQFIALLSINLAVFNLLPIPALDGGRLLFLVVEAIRRKPVTQQTEAIVHNLGFIALLLLVVIVSIHDVFKFF